ncbi:hypothetical protein ABX014_23305 [Snodgrassella alvi]|uniref:hypothetical protein n=1 Tax=Snodgrassella alvi TaxID=1196083 RepID=UPI00351CA64E
MIRFNNLVENNQRNKTTKKDCIMIRYEDLVKNNQHNKTAKKDKICELIIAAKNFRNAIAYDFLNKTHDKNSSYIRENELFECSHYNNGNSEHNYKKKQLLTIKTLLNDTLKYSNKYLNNNNYISYVDKNLCVNFSINLIIKVDSNSSHPRHDFENTNQEKFNEDVLSIFYRCYNTDDDLIFEVGNFKERKKNNPIKRYMKFKLLKRFRLNYPDQASQIRCDNAYNQTFNDLTVEYFSDLVEDYKQRIMDKINSL